MINMQEKLDQDVMFVKSYTPYDFRRNMHQYAVKIEYTNGDSDMLTTPMPPEIGNDKGNFKDDAEFFKFIEWLDSKGIKKN